MSRLVVNTLQGTAGNNNIISVSAGHTLYAPGHVIQVVETSITTPTAVAVPNNTASYTNVPDLFCSITPKNVNSKIYISVRWFGEFSASNTTWDSMFGIKRNGVSIGENPGSATAGSSRGIASPVLSYYAADGNSTAEQCFFSYIDSPASTSSLTYQVYINTSYASTMYTNRVVNASASAGLEHGRSNITLMEIAG